jgi:predicted phage-related endonuclease
MESVEMTLHVVKTEAEWLALRKLFITASEAAVLVGADPYSSPSKLRNPEPFSGNSFTRVGQMLEPVVVNVFNDVMGTHFELFETADGSKEFYTDGAFGATPDAHEDRKRLLECKTTRPQTYIKYSSVPPSKYLIQLLVQLMCTGLTDGYLAIMSTDLTQRTNVLYWPITIYRVWTDDRISVILKEEAERYTKNDSFRVSSKVKQKMKLLLEMSYERIS